MLYLGLIRLFVSLTEDTTQEEVRKKVLDGHEGLISALVYWRASLAGGCFWRAWRRLLSEFANIET